MKKSILYSSRLAALIAAAVLAGCGGGSSVETSTDLNAVDTSVPVEDWQLVWADEFEGSSIDSSKWTHEVNCDGGGNQEKQCYTADPSNSYVDNGSLKIVAKPTEDADASQPYTSARMNSRYKADFKYGRFEMRAKMPSGQGSWPAFWMMSTDEKYGGWPKSGEIDIVETVNLKVPDDAGVEESRVYGTLHYGKDAPLNSQSGTSHTPDVNPADEFNTYAVEWEEGEIRWYFNGYLYATQLASEVTFNSNGDANGLSNRGWFLEQFDPLTGEKGAEYSPAPFNEQFYMILNLAVGGAWPENVNQGGIDASAFADGQTFEIDYIRVYECAQDPVTGQGCGTVRAGYNLPQAEGGANVEGRAPIPVPPSSGIIQNLTIFDDALDPNWRAFDDFDDTDPVLVADEDTERGDVYEFSVEYPNGGDGAVYGFATRKDLFSPSPEETAEASPHDALPMVETGNVIFDMKLVSSPIDASAQWFFKIESVQAATAVDFLLTEYGPAPVIDQWITYTIPLQDLSDLGLDLVAIDIVMVFPTWGIGEGAQFRLDNVRIEDNAQASIPDTVLEGTDLAAFGDAVRDGDSYTWPTGSEDWAGFANETTDIYPMSFPFGGKITFTGSIPEGGSDTSVRFRFERLPHPDVDPAFDTPSVTVSGTTPSTYEIVIDPQDPSNTFESFLFYLNDRDSTVNVADIVVTQYGNGVSDGSASLEGTDLASFGGAVRDGDTYTFPAAAESWAGFANETTDIYPMSFPNGGSITFTGAIPNGGGDTNVRFRFERLPHPNVDPAFDTAAVTVSGSDEATYTITIDPQPAANTYESFLMYLNEVDSPVIVKDIVVNVNGSTGDGSTGGNNGGTGGNASTDVEMLAFADSGAIRDGDVYTFPTGAETWAGFANNNATVFPYTFEFGGTVTFNAAVPAGAADVGVYFRLEDNPFPNVGYQVDSNTVMVSGSTMTSYTATFAPQAANQEFNSLLMYLVTQDIGVTITDIVVTANTAGDAGGDDGETRVGVDMLPFADSGAARDGDVYSFPTGSEVWAGFANDNASVYPYTFEFGGTVTFNAAVPAGAADAGVYFRLEDNPFPNVGYQVDSETAIVSGSTMTSYTVNIAPQSASQTFNSFLMYLTTNDIDVTISDITVTPNTTSGNAPAGTNEPLFVDSVRTDWIVWDCCGGSTPELIAIDGRGTVVQYTQPGNGESVQGVTTRSAVGGGDALLDVIASVNTGILAFDLFIVSRPDTAVDWLVQIESNGGINNGATGEQVVLNVTASNETTAPAVGQWISYSFDLADLANQGLDLSAIDAITVFPAWGTGGGAVYQLDNLRVDAAAPTQASAAN